MFGWSINNRYYYFIIINITGKTFKAKIKVVGIT